MEAQKKLPLLKPGLAVFSGILMFLSFSLPRGIILFPVAWVCLAPLIASLKDTRPRTAFLLGFLAGVVGCFGIYYWIPYCMINYANMSRAIAYFALLLLVLMLACFVGVFAWLTRWLETRSAFPPIFFGPLIWVSLEYLRTYFPLGGFPWALLGGSQYKFLQLIQISEAGGVYIVSWLVALVNFGIAGIFKNWPPEKKEWQALGFSLACFAMAVVFGSLRIRQIDEYFSEKPELKVAIVQGNIDQGVKWNREYFWSSMIRHIELSKDLLKEPQDLLIWPEAAVTTNFNVSWQEKDSLAQALSVFDTYFLFGGIYKQESAGKNQYYNSAFMLSPRGAELLGHYSKMHLVPFGEYVPMKKLLFWVDAIAKGNTGDTDPGKELMVFETPKFKIACVICYELIFPNQVRKFVKAGAQVMSTITNDAWFGPTSAPWQHHSNMVFRAVENRVYFIRAANTGISSICDPCGRVLTQSGIYEVAQLKGTVKPSDYLTLYTRFGDWFCWLSLCLTIPLLAFILFRKQKPESGGNNVDK